MNTPCWLWPGALTAEGYGTLSLRRSGGYKKALAHRVMYQLAKKEIPQDAQLDHLCRNRACVNPDHLEPVSVRENLIRGDTLAAQNLAKDVCPQGHPYDSVNTYHYKNTRMCRICKREACRRSAQRRKERGNG